MKNYEPLNLTGIIVIARCGKDKLRLIPLTIKQSNRVRRFITHLHGGGGIHVESDDLILLTEKDALAAYSNLTGIIPWRERLAKWFDRLRRKKIEIEAIPLEVVDPEPAMGRTD